MEHNQEQHTDEHMQHDTTHTTRAKPMIIFIIVVIVLVGIFYYLNDGNGMMSERGMQVEVVTSEPGAIVENFPEELLVEEGVFVNESYSLNYTGVGSEQPVIIYASQWSLPQNVEEFGIRLSDAGWDITRLPNPLIEEGVTFIYAEKPEADVNVTFTKNETGVMVSIAYLMK